MPSIRWFRVAVYENSKKASAYFYETDTGLFDLQYGFGKYTARMHDSLDNAMKEFKGRLQAEHDRLNDGVQVTLGEATEVPWEEVKESSPAASGFV
jgi:hypothetical protein